VKTAKNKRTDTEEIQRTEEQKEKNLSDDRRVAAMTVGIKTNGQKEKKVLKVRDVEEEKVQKLEEKTKEKIEVEEGRLKKAKKETDQETTVMTKEVLIEEGKENIVKNLKIETDAKTEMKVTRETSGTKDRTEKTAMTEEG